MDWGIVSVVDAGVGRGRRRGSHRSEGCVPTGNTAGKMAGTGGSGGFDIAMSVCGYAGADVAVTADVDCLN